jgi:hypothetical protein
MINQCSSCGGFCRKSGCERENVKPKPTPQRTRVVFPTMLRKMWSGSEVQAWLDENVNKDKNTRGKE